MEVILVAIRQYIEHKDRVLHDLCYVNENDIVTYCKNQFISYCNEEKYQYDIFVEAIDLCISLTRKQRKFFDFSTINNQYLNEYKTAFDLVSNN